MNVLGLVAGSKIFHHPLEMLLDYTSKPVLLSALRSDGESLLTMNEEKVTSAASLLYDLVLEGDGAYRAIHS